MRPMLDIADLAQRRAAAEAAAEGAALVYAFGNVYARAQLDRGRSVTTTPEKTKLVFDWDEVRLPWSALVAVMIDLHALGPIAFRGPAAGMIPDHLTVTEDGVRTVRLDSPGDACPSNALVGQILDLTGADFIALASAHGDLREDLHDRDDVILIGHRNERAIRRRYPHHRPHAPSVISFHQGRLVLERHGSLEAAMIERVANRHGLTLTTATNPVRRAARPRFPRRRVRVGV